MDLVSGSFFFFFLLKQHLPRYQLYFSLAAAGLKMILGIGKLVSFVKNFILVGITKVEKEPEKKKLHLNNN